MGLEITNVNLIFNEKMIYFLELDEPKIEARGLKPLVGALASTQGPKIMLNQISLIRKITSKELFVEYLGLRIPVQHTVVCQ